MWINHWNEKSCPLKIWSMPPPRKHWTCPVEHHHDPMLLHLNIGHSPTMSPDRYISKTSSYTLLRSTIWVAPFIAFTDFMYITRSLSPEKPYRHYSLRRYNMGVLGRIRWSDILNHNTFMLIQRFIAHYWIELSNGMFFTYSVLLACYVSLSRRYEHKVLPRLQILTKKIM